MTGLILSEVILFATAIVLGGAVGYLLRAQLRGLATRAVEHDVEVLRSSLNEARVRKAGR